MKICRSYEREVDLEKVGIMIIESIQIENFQCFYGRLPETKVRKRLHGHSWEK